MECRYNGDCGGVGQKTKGRHIGPGEGWSPLSPTQITRSRWVGTDPTIRVKHEE